MSADKVVKFSELQKKKDERNRRQYQRVLMSNILGAFAVIDQKGLLEIDLVDISEEGIRFSMPKGYGMFRKGEKLAFRLYFSQDDYIPLIIKIAWRQADNKNGVQVVNYGCQIEADEEVKACIQSLIVFIQQYTNIAE